MAFIVALDPKFKDKLVSIIEKKEKGIIEKTGKKKNDFILLYYRECLRFSLYLVMEILMAGESLKIIEKIAEKASISENTLQKIGVISASMIKIGLTEKETKDNIKEIEDEITRIDNVLTGEVRDLYNQITQNIKRQGGVSQ